jgi:hypothetical protein
MKTRFPIILGLFLLGAASVFGQEKSYEKIEKQRELDRKTTILVNELAASASSLKLPENRSFLLANTADLMWKQDDKLSRNLFWESINNLNMIAATLSNQRSGKKPSKEQLANTYFTVFSLKKQLLGMAARRDPQFALELLNANRLTPPEGSNQWMPDERELEQQIAAEIIARDPQRALQAARESLAKGLSPELSDLLQRLNAKSPELATKFAGEIIDKLRTEDLGKSFAPAIIAVNLLTSSRPRTQQRTMLSIQGVLSGPLVLSDERRRELVELITDAALTLTGSGSLYYAVSDIMPEVEQFFPDRVPQLKRKLAQIEQTLDSDQREWNAHNAVIGSGNAEEMLRAAGNAKDEQRASLEDSAIVTAVMRGQSDSFRDLINREVSEDSRRKQLIDKLDSESLAFAAGRGDEEALQKMLPQIRAKEERVRAMAQLAILLDKKGKHELALKYLEEARSLVKIDIGSEPRAYALLDLILACALIEPSSAFELIERTIDRTNEEVSKAALLDIFVKSGMIKKGELVLNNNGGMPAEFALFKYGSGVTALANADFIRTKGLADRFQRNELRLMARLFLARALLSTPTLN